MAKPEKAAAVAELTERFRSSTASVLTEYRGLTVAQLKELRRSLGGNAQYAVVKNTLTAIAAKEAGVDAFDGQLTGPSAIAFVTGDPVEAAKGLRDFARTHPQLVIKSGYLEGRALDAAEITRLADLESREVLLAKLAGAMKASLNQAAYLFVAPLSQAARVVDALRAKVEEGAPASSAATAGSGGVHDGSAEAGSAEAGSADAGSADAGSAEAGSADAASGAAEAPSEPASEVTTPS